MRAMNRVAASARALHQQTPVSAAGGLFGKLFGGKKADEPAAPSAAVGDMISNQPEPVRFERTEKEPLRLRFPKRQYTTQQLEDRIQRILAKNDVAVVEGDWKATSLAVGDVKLKVLADVMKLAKLKVTNRMLNNVQTAGDLVNELTQKPAAKDAGHVVAQFYKEHGEELPANMKFEPFTKHGRKLHAYQ
ncbi:hypothetical protein DL89DRAFT_263678 [Linderina pennispora]|uniref:Uncharacterized protein n=1 Tax=Linderina pennispora TaxID=61395 RepID=A0A1Y1WJD2_9FUNG|nr:uncharacterized protein DL89DRAFT_263678 [Linderina pennispora]ORX73647.1 hypothetical protein DL89DRAFT_263678 [Linderina pennispora]